MIKKQQKWIALLVTLTFMWLLQVSAMPLNAAGTNEPVAAASPDQGPRYVEKEDGASPAVGKKSILPLVLIGVGVVAVAAVLFLVVLKTSYDITGTWNFNFASENDIETINITFSGDKKSGTFTMSGLPNSGGTYAVDGKKLTMSPTNFPKVIFVGEFTGKDAMSGTLTEDGSVINWTATRGAAAASSRTNRELQSGLLMK